MSDHDKSSGSGENLDEESAVDFEASLQQLEDLVQEMESGELTLEQSLVAFEKGVALARQCQDALRRAEERIAQLTNDDLSDG